MKLTVFIDGVLSSVLPYTRIHELISLLPVNTPMLAATATVTKVMLKHITQALNMVDYRLVHVLPERHNIYYQVKNRTSIEKDLENILSDLKHISLKANRVVIYSIFAPAFMLTLSMNWEIKAIILLVLRS